MQGAANSVGACAGGICCGLGAAALPLCWARNQGTDLEDGSDPQLMVESLHVCGGPPEQSVASAAATWARQALLACGAVLARGCSYSCCIKRLRHQSRDTLPPAAAAQGQTSGRRGISPHVQKRLETQPLLL